jgi:hypothetical protein
VCKKGELVYAQILSSDNAAAVSSSHHHARYYSSHVMLCSQTSHQTISFIVNYFLLFFLYVLSCNLILYIEGSHYLDKACGASCYLCVCVCVCVRARARARTCVFMCALALSMFKYSYSQLCTLIA